jgi:hypothetical protein
MRQRHSRPISYDVLMGRPAAVGALRLERSQILARYYIGVMPPGIYARVREIEILIAEAEHRLLGTRSDTHGPD